MNFLKRILIGLLLTVASFAALAQAPVLTNRSTELRASPDDAAKVIQQLSEKTEVKVIVRQGAWQQVRVGANTGWVRMMHLRGGSSIVAEEQSSGGWLAAFNKLLSGNDRPRANQRAQSATVGIRGFSKDDVAAAEMNPAAFDRLKGFQASDASAKRLANERRLAFRSVAYLAQDAVDTSNNQGARK